MNPKRQVATSEQVRGYMLCAECEDRFNKGGEAWILRNCWRTDTQFPLRSALAATTPVAASPTFAAFAAASIPGVDVDKLAYFAASVFWRGALKGWRRTADHVPVPLDLGRYEEQLRLFLHGDGGFPANVVLRTTVTASTKPVPHRIASFPFRKTADSRFHHYWLAVPGITFELFVGKSIPSDVRALCTVRSPERFLFSSTIIDEVNFIHGLRLYEQGHGGRPRPPKPKGR